MIEVEVSELSIVDKLRNLRDDFCEDLNKPGISVEREAESARHIRNIQDLIISQKTSVPGEKNEHR